MNNMHLTFATFVLFEAKSVSLALDPSWEGIECRVSIYPPLQYFLWLYSDYVIHFINEYWSCEINPSLTRRFKISETSLSNTFRQERPMLLARMILIWTKWYRKSKLPKSVVGSIFNHERYLICWQGWKYWLWTLPKMAQKHYDKRS